MTCQPSCCQIPQRSSSELRRVSFQCPRWTPYRCWSFLLRETVMCSENSSTVFYELRKALLQPPSFRLSLGLWQCYTSIQTLIISSPAATSMQFKTAYGFLSAWCLGLNVSVGYVGSLTLWAASQKCRWYQPCVCFEVLLTSLVPNYSTHRRQQLMVHVGWSCWLCRSALNSQMVCPCFDAVWNLLQTHSVCCLVYSTLMWSVSSK